MSYINHISRTATLLILLMAGWVTGCPLSAQTVVEVSPDPSTNLVGTDNGTAVQPLERWDISEYGISFKFTNGGVGTHPAYYYNGKSIRLYNGNSFTIESTADYTIESILFNTSAYNSAQTALSSDKGEVVYDNKNFVWNNTGNDSKATFSVAGSQVRIAKITLTLGGGSVAGDRPKAPVFSQGSCNFYKSFELAITDINDTPAVIKYTLDGTDPTADNGFTYTAPIVIPEGNSVTVKAVCINDNGISAITKATYTFIAKYLVTVKLPNKNGISRIYFSSDSEYGEWYDENSTYITSGENVYIGFSFNTGYKRGDIKLNGVSQNLSGNSLSFIMPSKDVEVVLDAVFDPSSPSDPNVGTGTQTQKYTLSLVSNPAGASALSGAGKYAEGESVYIRTSANTGYVFTGWTKDGESISTTTSGYYSMPASDVVLTANYIYNPASPSDPQQPTLKHPLTVVASPAGAGTFNISSSEVTAGESYYVYAYPNTGYKFKGWIVNGVAQETTSTKYRGVMTDAGAQVVGLFVFDPASPSNPGANYYNPTTGQVIIDDFTPGNLYSTLRDLVGSSNYGNVNSLIVKGIMTSGDYGALSYLTNAVTIDLSRTGGVTTVPGYAFQNMGASSILIPSTITDLENYVFRNCQNLTLLTIYAQEPPRCSSYTFSGFTNKDNCTLFVPASAIELYTSADYWKDFTIFPITDDAHVLQVNLPADAADGRYKNNSIELVNLNSGVRQKYVISDRLLYTFNGLRKDEQYNIYMFSQAGLELGRIENIVVPDDDFEVTFDNLKSVYTVKAIVMTPDGKDVTSDVTVEWLKPLADGTTTYLRKAVSLGEIPDGQELLCRVTLNNQLGTVYVQPEDSEFTVDGEHNTCTVTLVPFRVIELSGTVTDGDGAALAGASVSANQTLNGKYSKTYTTKTDRKGQWNLSVLDAPETRLTFAASECVNLNDTVGAFESSVSVLDLGKKVLRSIVGARVTYGFTYHAAGVDEVQDYYSDYQNVAVNVFNVTQDREHKEVSLQYPVIAVLDENINAGDELKLTATSKTGAFNPIVKTVTVGENQRAEVTFDIVGKGGISASFEMTDNPSVIAMLYSDKGELKKKQTYSEAQTTFTDLEDGDYTLVTMGKSDLMSSILRLSNFDEIGLKEGKDYVKNSVKVETGKLAEVKIPEVPAFDESLFYYTNSNTSFTSNKSSITTGNYLTLRAAIDFKGVYKNDISNVALVVDLPEACDFVEQSVIQGPNQLPYTIDNNRLTIQLGNNYQTQTRFCVIPTAGGSFNATASIVFDYNGKTLTQPIGSATSEIKDLEINVPSVIASPKFKVSGSSLGKSEVKIISNGAVIGSGKANAAGSWTVECELVNPYNLSKHQLFAEITTPAGVTMVTETKDLTYDMNAIQVSKVTMYHWNPELNYWKGRMEISEFDFQNPKTTPTPWIVYYPKKVFTYTIEFTNNDPEVISNVILYVHTADGRFVPVNATFDENKGMWYAEIDMGKSPDNYYPVNCSVDFDYNSIACIDSDEYNNCINSNELSRTELELTIDKLNEIDFKLESYYDTEAQDVDIINLLRESRIISGAGIELEAEELGELSEEEAEQYSEILISEIDNFLNTETYNVFDEAFTGSLSEVAKEMEGITVSTCDGLIPDELLENGYTEIMRTASSSIYVLSTESEYRVVDFDNNYLIVIDLNTNSSLANLVKFRANGDDFEQKMNDYLQKTNAYWDNLRDIFSRVASLVEEVIEEVDTRWVANKKKLHQLDYAIEWLEKQPYKYKPNWRKISRDWIRQRNKLNKNIAQNTAISDWLRKNISPNGLRVGKIGGGIFALIDAGLVIKSAIDDFTEIVSIYNSVPDPCEGDLAKAKNLKDKIYRTGIGAGVYYIAQFASDVIQIMSLFSGVAAIVPSGGSSITLVGASIGLAVANFLACKGYEIVYANRMNDHYQEAMSLKCLKECGKPGQPKCPIPPGGGGGNPGGDGNGGNGGNGNGGGGNGSGSPDDKVEIDPSGYVYEAVPENRVEGVQATIYYKETKEDMYGDPYEEIVLWDAEEYAQKNPLFTDEYGMYQWDVPQGLWRVKFEKDGYQTAYSEWLPVPPPQLDVNIGIVQNKQPEVTEARAYEEGVEVQFDKFMDLSTLTTDNIFVTANGEKLNGEIRLIDSALADEFADEEDEDATRYASRARFVPEEKLSATTGEIRVTVSRNVLSYAGIPMTETFSQVLDVEKEVQAIYADDVKVLYGGEKEVTVYALPYDAAVGRKLHITNSSDLIASVDVTEAVLDEEGKAVVKVKGDLPGRSQLTFTIDDVTATGDCAVDVVTEIITAEAPQASRASGTAVYRGTKVELTTESKNATIYFTTDGSCPCDENGTRRKYTVPIIIDDDTQILAMTTVGSGEGDTSETVQFNYTLKRSDMDFKMEEGWTWMSHSFESSIAPADLAADENVSRILSSTKEVIRDPQLGLIGTLTELSAPESYKVETTAATSRQRMSDVAWNPATPIALNPGWNWLGYPVGQTMSVDEAFATTDAETLDIVVGQNGFAQFDGENWIGTLETMSPGMGYMYQSQSAKNVVYNTSIVSTASAKYAPGISTTSPLVLDIHKYGVIMPVVATISAKDGAQLDNEEYQVAAFCGTECRGIGRVVNGLVMMNVYGNVNDPIRFNVTDADGEIGFPTDASLNFSETVIGDLYSPYTITINNESGISDVKYDGNVKVLAEGDMLLIKGIPADEIKLVEVYDTNGQKVIHEANVSESGIRISTLTAGVYVVIVNGNGDYTYHKIALR